MVAASDKAAYQAAGLAALSNLIAQGMTIRKQGVSLSVYRGLPVDRSRADEEEAERTFSDLCSDTHTPHAQRPLSIDGIALLQFVLFAFLTTPPNYAWQVFLENSFPGYSVSKREEKEASSRKVQETKKLNVRNTAIKFFLDQLIGSTVNTIVFVAAFAFFRGESIREACAAQFWPMRIASLKVWPLVSLCRHFMCFLAPVSPRASP